MKTKSKLLLNSVAAGMSLACSAMAVETPSEGLSAPDYGSLYVVEQRDRDILPWKFSGGYSYEFGNPFSHIQGLNGTFERALGRFTWIGIQGGTYFSSGTTLSTVLDNEIEKQNISKTVQTPSSSVYGIFTIVPLSGHMTFFGGHPLQTELAIRTGLGRIAYADGGPRLGMLWSIRPTVYFSKQISAQLGVTQEFESPFQSSGISRFRGDVGIGFHF